MESVAGTAIANGDGVYPTTVWSKIALAGRTDDEHSVAALSSLLEKYYRPLQKHLESAFCADPDAARDWLQSFIHRKVILGKLLRLASRDKGRFRTFVLNALDNFVISELRRTRANKRHPKEGVVSIHEMPRALEIPVAPPQSRQFSVQWAREVTHETLERMQSECAAKGDLRRWHFFSKRLLEPALDGAKPPGYEELVKEFGFESPAEASNCLITARRQFARLLRVVVAEYVGEEAAEAELRELFAAVAG
jgi:hypothetical protein